MTQCCHKTHKGDNQDFPKINADQHYQLFREKTKGTSTQYHYAAREAVTILSIYLLYCYRIGLNYFGARKYQRVWLNVTWMLCILMK